MVMMVDAAPRLLTMMNENKGFQSREESEIKIISTHSSPLSKLELMVQGRRMKRRQPFKVMWHQIISR